MVCLLFLNCDDCFICFSYLRFIARFTCSNGLVCCIRDKVSGGDNMGFHAIEGYWVGVKANHSWAGLKNIKHITVLMTKRKKPKNHHRCRQEREVAPRKETESEIRRR